MPVYDASTFEFLYSFLSKVLLVVAQAESAKTKMKGLKKCFVIVKH